MKTIDWIETPASPLTLSDLKGKTALVTGATMGIGRATVKQLLANGTQVVGLARGELKPQLDEYADLYQDFPCDLEQASEIEATLMEIQEHLPHLDYVVNVAGRDPKFTTDAITQDEWDRLIDLNLRGYFWIIKHALPLLRKGTGKSIVNISSINYRLSVPGRTPYSATKAGILGLTTGFARELGAEGIRINTVTPGWIFTERQVDEYFSGNTAEKNLSHLRDHQCLPLKIRAGDIANHILFYLSNVSRAATGTNNVVDAGWLLE
ncbi:MAG: SDR family oxidoreductase [Verrucomicrobiota bacterium]